MLMFSYDTKNINMSNNKTKTSNPVCNCIKSQFKPNNWSGKYALSNHTQKCETYMLIKNDFTEPGRLREVVFAPRFFVKFPMGN